MFPAENAEIFAESREKFLADGADLPRRLMEIFILISRLKYRNER